jgi:YesN/AraC family two-component response regulator
MLEREDYEVSVLQNAYFAENVISRKMPDLVITDMIMPGRDGCRIIMALKDSFPDIKIIAISGGGCFPAELYLELANEFGADKFFFKPVERHALIDSVDERQL